MYGVLSIERARPESSGTHGTGRGRQRCGSQPGEAPRTGSLPAESGFDSGGLGHRGKPPEGCSHDPFRHSDAGIDAVVPGFTASGTDRGKQGFLKTLVLALIAFYRSSISAAIPSSCRFYPTCSAYAYEAVSRWGVRRGAGMTLRRLLRCRPLGGYGYDPVP